MLFSSSGRSLCPEAGNDVLEVEIGVRDGVQVGLVRSPFGSVAVSEGAAGEPDGGPCPQASDVAGSFPRSFSKATAATAPRNDETMQSIIVRFIGSPFPKCVNVICNGKIQP